MARVIAWHNLLPKTITRITGLNVKWIERWLFLFRTCGSYYCITGPAACQKMRVQRQTKSASSRFYPDAVARVITPQDLLLAMVVDDKALAVAPLGAPSAVLLDHTPPLPPPRQHVSHMNNVAAAPAGAAPASNAVPVGSAAAVGGATNGNHPSTPSASQRPV